MNQTIEQRTETFLKVRNRIYFVLNHRSYVKRPKEMKILHLAKALQLTYMQVRRVIDKLVKRQDIEKFHRWEKNSEGKFVLVNYYRWLGR